MSGRVRSLDRAWNAVNARRHMQCLRALWAIPHQRASSAWAERSAASAASAAVCADAVMRSWFRHRKRILNGTPAGGCQLAVLVRRDVRRHRLLRWEIGRGCPRAGTNLNRGPGAGATSGKVDRSR